MAELYSLHEMKLTTPGTALFAALSDAVPGLTRHKSRQAIMAGLVTVDGKVLREPKFELPEKATVRLDLRQGLRKAVLAGKHGAAPDPGAKPFAILYEDPQLIVVDKSPGVLSAPTKHDDDDDERGHVPELLRIHWKQKGRKIGFIGLVHRLDLDTSGCLCFALTREGQRLLAAQFAGGAAGRTYRCLVAGKLAEDSGTVRTTLGRGDDGRRSSVEEGKTGKEAVTHWKVLRRFAHGAELELTLETGRTHQIRIHLAELGCPVLGDRIYGRRQPFGAPKVPRLMLHAWRLALDHPRTGARVEVTAPLPASFAEVAELLQKG